MELVKPFNISQPAISKHLKVLEKAGLISHTTAAQSRPRKLEPAPIAQAAAWLETYRANWEAKFMQLDALLDEMQTINRQVNTEPNTRER